jgi:hypothetical protein
MDWRQKLEIYESAEEWQSAVEHMNNVLSKHDEDAEAWVRMLYLLHNIALEHRPSIGTTFVERCEKQLLDLFNSSRDKFANNSEYLFFMGVIGRIAEWLFGEKEMDFALIMSQKAADLEPENMLYRWAILDPNKNKEECEFNVDLARQILDNSPEKKWLEQKGFPGRYVLDVQLKGSAGTVCLEGGIRDYESVIPYREKGKGTKIDH